ncbi:hypothetical protein [Plantactinospora sp. CA-290183]|uniref:hypothetical protein n=1 Tax=Plantactinospora sp. CA-290183 TaxID=3240006 RepID=UPI003D8B2A27
MSGVATRRVRRAQGAEKICHRYAPKQGFIALTWHFAAPSSSTIRSVGTIRRTRETGRHLRVLSILGLAILPLLAASAGYVVLAMVLTPTIEERAHREAVRQAAVLGDALVRGAADEAADIGRSAGRDPNVEVLTVDGADRRASPGVRLVFRVHVAVSRPAMAGRASAEVDVCFRQVLDRQRADFSRTEVPCPAVGAPPTPSPEGEPVPGATPAR